jgi:hypothetical protein
MTLETIADMVWGLGHCINVEIFDPKDRLSNEHRIVPAHPLEVCDGAIDRKLVPHITFNDFDAGSTIDAHFLEVPMTMTMTRVDTVRALSSEPSTAPITTSINSDGKVARVSLA